MIRLKSERDIEKLAEGGKILAQVLDKVAAAVRPGLLARDLDKLARDLIAGAGCRPAFLNYAPAGQEPYPAALCISIDEAVVHGLPGDSILNEGNVVGLDLGLIYQNKYYLDSARTVGVGEITPEARRLMTVTKKALERGIEAAQVGNRIGDIGAAIQRYVEDEGYQVVKQLVGHGVGYAVHEEPQVPNFGEPGQGKKLTAGLVIAIEPMVTIGEPEVTTDPDGWTVRAPKGVLAAHEEHTIAITPSGPRILTK